MAEVAEAYVSLVPSAKGFKRGIEREIGGDVERAGRNAGAKSGKAFGGAFGGAVKGLGAVVGVGAVAGFFTDSINKASQLEQSVGGVQAVFGKYADSVLADSKKANQALGLSANAYNELITVSAALLKNKGLEDFAEQAKNLVSVGADLSAQFGGSTREAVEALNAAMRGESDPIERYGISLNETAVNAVLAAKGQKNLTGAALEQAKAQARLALITKQSADAQGAFAREADTMAGQQQRALAQFEDTRAELGQAFLPVTTDLFELLNDDVVPAITDFVRGMKDGTGAGGEFADVLGDVKDIGEVVVDIVTAIPEPILKFGTAIGLGAVAVGKMNTAVAGSRLTGFVTDLKAAETRADRSARALQGLGAAGRNVAGAGGLLLLADATGKANKGLGALEGAAGGAALGFAVGGPLGAGIGAAAGGLLGFVTSGEKAEDQLVELGPPTLTSTGEFEDYASTLEGVSAALSDATKEMAYNRLEQSGLLDKTRALGIEDRAVLNGIVGTSRQRDILAAKMRKQNQEGSALAQTLELERRGINGSRLAQLQKNLAIAETREEVKSAQRALDIFKKTNATATIKVDGVTQVKQELTGLLGLLTEIASFTGSTGAPLNRDQSGLFPRALGGSVGPAQTYLVGERGPELFTTGTRGHITSNNRLSNLAGGGAQRMVLSVGGREFTAFVEEVADTRVDAAEQIRSMTERAYR